MDDEIKTLNDKIEALIDRNDLFFYSLFKRNNETRDESKHRFLKSIYLDDKQIKLLQEGNLILLKKIIDICNKNNIKYCLWVGSALGTYLYKGFIPWDDDIDIMMMQDEFNKLLKAIEKENEFEIINFIRLGLYDILPKFTFKNRNLTFFIDIFVFCETNLPLKKALELKKIKRDKMIQQIKKNKKTKLIDSRGISLEDNIKSKQKYPEYYEYYNNWNETTYIDKSLPLKPITGVVFNSNFYDIEAYEYDIIFPLKKSKFEGVDVFIPNKIEKFLKLRYGYLYNLPLNFKKSAHCYVSGQSQIDFDKETSFLKKYKKN